MKQIEYLIQELTDVAELNRIGRQYANSGNFIVAMKAWLRAAEFGDKQCRPSIVSTYLSRYWSTKNEDHSKAAKLIKQWREEGDEEVIKALELQIKLRSVFNTITTDSHADNNA